MDDISKIRNVGVIAHIDAGKTTTTERILFYSGRIHNLGYVDEGTTTTDWYRLEREMGISIFSAVTTIYWDNYQINIIDTPGHIDFTAEVERSLRVLDGSIIVFCGVAGVQAQSETVWKQADRYKLPRIVYINKLDRNGSDYKRVFHEISTKLNCTLIPITIPLYKENQFVGVIDTIHANCLYFDDKDEGVTISTGQIEPSQLEYFQYWKEILLDNLSKFDDDTLKDVIECREISSDAMLKTIRRLTLASRIIPVYAGSSLKNKGVQPIINGVNSFLPSPLDRLTVTAKVYAKELNKIIDLNTEKETILYVFKTFSDLHNTTSYARIYSGKVQKGDKFYNPRSDKHERIGNIFKVHADEVTTSAFATKGDIIALSNLKHTRTGDTLVSNNKIMLEGITFPASVVSSSIEPKSSADKDKLLEVLEKIRLDDPTFKYNFNTETNQMVISGMGELHLHIISRRIQEDFKVAIKIGKPMVSYKETILSKSSGFNEHSSKLHDQNIYGAVGIDLIPDNTTFHPVAEFLPSISREADKFKEVITNAVLGALQSGELIGYQVINAKCLVKEVRMNEFSHEIGYSISSTNAVKIAMKNAQMTLLEPFMKISISVPEEYIGNVLNDLNSRNVVVKDLKKGETESLIDGIAPLSEMFGFADSLRSKTHGRGFFMMEPFEYKQVSDDRLKELKNVYR